MSVRGSKYNIIPLPDNIKAGKGDFVIDENTVFATGSFNSGNIANAVSLFTEQLSTVTSLKFKMVPLAKVPPRNVIAFIPDKRIVGEEAYKLSISPQKITIGASSAKGCFYALQTLRQLLPTGFEAMSAQNNTEWKIPCCTITDSPRYKYRGLHLDVCRHFVPVEELKKIIDQLALLKINTFHWHLTDDQGWRIEIKKYPGLTSTGAYRNQTLTGHYNDKPRKYDQTRYGGFYTQDEIKEVVRYAAQRYVDILPEIEMPGHAVAALAAYPQFSCSGGPFEVQGLWGVFNDVFCTKEATFTFLQDVLDEVTSLFPYPYIHIGGDECPTIRWQNCVYCQNRMKEEGLQNEHELQKYFIHRIENYLNSKGKKIIGWEEILNPQLNKSSVLMSWTGEQAGLRAARQGYDVIMSPSSHLYLDYYQSQLSSEPLAIGGYVPIERVYAYNPPYDSLSAGAASHIIGIQANTWTEYMPDEAQRFYMIFPRLAALAEVGWTSSQRRNFDDFASRLPSLLNRYDLMGINYSKAFYDIEGKTIRDNGKLLLRLQTKGDAPIRFTTDGSAPGAGSPLCSGPIILGQAVTVKALPVSPGGSLGRLYNQAFVPNLFAGAEVKLSAMPSSKYAGQGGLTLVDCIEGRYPLLGSQWLGYEGCSITVDIDLKTPVTVSQLSLGFTQQEGQYIYAPEHVAFFISKDGNNFEPAGETDHSAILNDGCKAVVSFSARTVQKVRAVVKSTETVPAGGEGAGSPAWLFMDEFKGKN
jgi:hexosaminidase